jgi:prepilin-type N-terminal cleavage/methylation domain-containing protein
MMKYSLRHSTFRVRHSAVRIEISRGFTLLEVLISVAVLAMIMAVLYGAYGSGVETVRAAREQGEIQQSARIVLERMSLELESAVAGKEFLFVGENVEMEGRPADRIDFNRFGGKGEGDFMDLFHLTYVIAKDPEVEEDNQENGFVLTCLEERVIRPGIVVSGPPLELARMVRGLDITYFDSEGADFEEWNSNGGEHLHMLPSFIRIRLTLGTESGREQTFTTGIRPELAGP